MDGLTLSRWFYERAARPIIESVVAPEDYAAALIGWSSEVLGFDDACSRDHNWGPRFIVFLRAEHYERQAQPLDERLRNQLPYEFLGYPVHFGPTPLGDQRAMHAIQEGPVSHFIQIERLDHYLQHFLGLDVRRDPTFTDWLALPEHNLLGFTHGLVFHDGPGELGAWRARLSFYPEAVWYHLLARQWHGIAEEEAFAGRCAGRGDTLGELLLIGRMVERLMRLVFLMERTYAPYSKWLGTAFLRLRHAPELAPHLTTALQASTAQQREAALAQAYVVVARIHNQLGTTPPIDETLSPPYEGRPGLVIHAGRFADALERAMQRLRAG